MIHANPKTLEKALTSICPSCTRGTLWKYWIVGAVDVVKCNHCDYTFYPDLQDGKLKSKAMY